MKVSLILTTEGNYNIKNFLESLKRQSYKSFELIVLDQSKDERLKRLIEEYETYFEIKYIKNIEKGISINRNKGLLYASSEILSFPSEDTVYDDNTIERAVNYLYNNPKSIYLCNVKDLDMVEEDKDISAYNLHYLLNESNFFVNTSEDTSIYFFDTNLGKGSDFKSSENIDYILNLIHKGYTGKYFSNQYIYKLIKNDYLNDIDLAYEKFLGYGAVCKKEVFKRKEIFYYIIYITHIAKSVYNIILNKNREYNKTVLQSIRKGYKEYN